MAKNGLKIKIKKVKKKRFKKCPGGVSATRFWVEKWEFWAIPGEYFGGNFGDFCCSCLTNLCLLCAAGVKKKQRKFKIRRCFGLKKGRKGQKKRKKNIKKKLDF